MRKVTVAATQMPSGKNNMADAEKLVRSAAKEGANIILLQELFEGNYFCQKQKEQYINLATTLDENPAVNHFSKVARELNVVLPISFFEKYNNAYYNSIAVIDADGSVLGIYRKSHIPDGPGYSEKFYFNPGDTGFVVFDTAFGRIGIGICWDQWFPECARVLALRGAELIFYPTAIGSEPQDATLISKDHWQICMQGHAAANLVPVIASNRVGVEDEEDYSITFYGASFIADNKGQKVAEMSQTETGVITATFDLDELMFIRRSWGVFRDRRPELYEPILTLDGENYRDY